MSPLPSPAEGPQLIAYADRFGGNLAGLRQLLETQFAGVFDGVHILPFYTPYDGADAGFDPRDHTAVDPRLGAWSDVRALSECYTVMADAIVNHMSAASAEFSDVKARGDQSPWSAMFLTLASIFPDGVSEADLARIYRPRPGLPFTVMALGGTKRLVWTTFTHDQVDLDIRQPEAWKYLTSVIERLTDAGVSLIRLDAVGYTGKEAGTSCFMTESTKAFIDRLAQFAHNRGARILVEVHGHFLEQVELARRVDLVYDFALPPLLIHALTTADLAPLATWIELRPTNAVTVLDTHDGIGIIDVGPQAGQVGLLSQDQIRDLVEGIHQRSHGASQRATGAAASNLDLYQVNCTFYEALGRNDTHYLLARLVQLMLPGIPQIYYVGLLAGENDLTLLEATGIGRDINRHRYEPAEITSATGRPVVQALLAVIRLRRTNPAFMGQFFYHIDESQAEFTWDNGLDGVKLVWVAPRNWYELRLRSGGQWRVLLDADSWGSR